MANVIIFTDNPPRNLSGGDTPLYLRYQTKPAGAYAIASNLRRNGYSVLVVNNCSSYTLAGIKQIINNNSEDLLWVGISTTFFAISGSCLGQYRDNWKHSSHLAFADGLAAIIGQTNLDGRANLKVARELIWNSEEINLIADHCIKYNAPLLIGGAWVSNILNGNLQNLRDNVHILTGRSENATLGITRSLSSGATIDLQIKSSNQDYDDVFFKTNQYQWEESDLITADEWLPVEISRGCAFNCAYCSYDRKSNFDTYRDPDVIRSELIKNYEKFGVTKYILMDDLYNESKDKVRLMYDKVWSKLPFAPEWASYMRLDMVWADPDSAEILKASGAKMGSFGIETLHNKAGSKVGKGLGKERILETLEHLKSVWKDDVLIHSYFIAGLPDEPEDSILETINWTTNTKLVDTVSYTPLWITPPTHNKFVVITNAMSLDNEKYNLSWADDNTWINPQGVTFNRANELAAAGNKSRAIYIGAFGEYVEYRQLGVTHQEIVNLKEKAYDMANEKECLDFVNSIQHIAIKNIDSKVKKTLERSS